MLMSRNHLFRIHSLGMKPKLGMPVTSFPVPAVVAVGCACLHQQVFLQDLLYERVQNFIRPLRSYGEVGGYVVTM